jgi:integrase
MTQQNHPQGPLYLKLGQWPDPDRKAWRSATSSGDVLDDGGLAAHWSEGTRRKIAENYGRWLGFLSERGRLDPDADPADRVQRDLVRRYVAELEAHCAPRTVVMRVEELLSLLSVMRPERDWSWLKTAVLGLRAKHRHGRARPANLPAAGAVFDWGCQEIRAAEDAEDLRPRRRAGRYRDGLIIALLVARPLRRRNFAGIEIDRHLIKTSDGYVVVFDASETKTHQPLEFAVPDDLAQPLARYVANYRPILLGDKTSPRLWITERGKPYSDVGFASRIRQITTQAFGRSLNPHVFRHIAATSIATDDPEHARIIAPILGHATLRTADMHYNRARQLDAGQLFQDSLSGLRKRLKNGVLRS